VICLFSSAVFANAHVVILQRAPRHKVTRILNFTPSACERTSFGISLIGLCLFHVGSLSSRCVSIPPRKDFEDEAMGHVRDLSLAAPQNKLASPSAQHMVLNNIRHFHEEAELPSCVSILRSGTSARNLLYTASCRTQTRQNRARYVQ
jgi:hypothetical protein